VSQKIEMWMNCLLKKIINKTNLDYEAKYVIMVQSGAN
jgi:hypothetical protein